MKELPEGYCHSEKRCQFGGLMSNVEFCICTEKCFSMTSAPYFLQMNAACDDLGVSNTDIHGHSCNAFLLSKSKVGYKSILVQLEDTIKFTRGGKKMFLSAALQGFASFHHF